LNTTIFVVALTLFLGVLVPTVGMANPMFCSDTSDGNKLSTPVDSAAAPKGLNVTDVSFRSAAADDCYGVVTDSDGKLDLNASAIWGTGWALVAQGSAVGYPVYIKINGIAFKLAVSPDTSPGFWTLLWMEGTGGAPDIAFPATFDFAIVLNAGQSGAAYLFDSETLLLNPGQGDGQFSIRFSDTPDLSQLSVYARYVQPASATDARSVPEPHSLALLGLGLGLAGLVVARRTA
jgi:hypothetical protein